MKGLLIKDFKLMKNQRQFFTTIVLLTIAFMSVYKNLNFVISYMTILFGMFAVSSISYDRYDNGESYLFTLPISKRTYVIEKYVFGLLLSVSALSVVSIFTWIAAIVRHMDYPLEEFISIAISSLLIIVFMHAYMVPINLKFTADKNRIVLSISVGIVLLVVFLFLTLVSHLGIGGEIEAWFTNLINHKAGMLIGTIILIAAVLLVISYNISVRIMERKEF